MTTKAMEFIERSLQTIIEGYGRKIDPLVLYVTPGSPLVELKTIETKYGTLRVQGNPHLIKGAAYIMEDPGEPGRALDWVIRNET